MHHNLTTYVNTHLRLEEDTCEKDGRYGTRGTHCAVIPVVTVFDQIPDRRGDDGCKIQDHIENLPRRHAPDGSEIRFHYPAEEEQGEHIEEEMAPAAVNEAVREHLPPFSVVPHVVCAELQGVEIQNAVEAQQANDYCDGYDDECYHECKDTEYPENGNGADYLEDSKEILNLQNI